MDSTMKALSELGICKPKILLPNSKVKAEKWGVVACDQYTSQHKYWEKLSKFVGKNPSTLNLVFPEIFLEQPDFKERVVNIQKSMHHYLSEKILEEHEGFMLVERTLPTGKKRIGLMMAIDLEKYDFSPDSKSLIRPSEGTILSRIPIRVDIRRDAPMELPHILLLINDEKKSIIEPLYKKVREFKVKYNTTLTMKGGKIRGFAIPDKFTDHLVTNFNKLLGKSKSKKAPLLFVVGDGNHSLAAAKSHWMQIKDKVGSDHPARYALVETINIHDPALSFEPIHRVIFNTNQQTFFEELDLFFKGKRAKTKIVKSKPAKGKAQIFEFLCKNRTTFVKIEPYQSEIESGVMQEFIDAFLKKYPKASVDYIHGQDAVEELASTSKNIGILLSPLKKNQLLPFIEKYGPLPRKCFSLGEADEKRFYFEARLIK